MDPGSSLKKLLIFAALEANQITLPYNSADNFVTDSFKLEKYRYRERSRKLRNWHVDFFFSLVVISKHTTKQLQNATYPESL